MCCCGKPTINGELGYKWQPNHVPSIHPTDPPDLQDGDTLLFDEPGRCGRSSDSHSFHFRLVRNTGAIDLLVHHGGGAERHRFGWAKTILAPLSALNSEDRYWLLCAAYHACSTAARDAAAKESQKWSHAAAEKRIRTRKQPARGTVKVWIEPPSSVAAA